MITTPQKSLVFCAEAYVCLDLYTYTEKLLKISLQEKILGPPSFPPGNKKHAENRMLLKSAFKWEEQCSQNLAPGFVST